MTFFPAGFDPSDNTVALFEMVNINTTEGDFGFLLGVDGIFTDVNGKVWYGSTIINTSSVDSALNGTAPAGQLTVSFFQDPNQPDVISEMQALGVDYVKNRPVKFYLQPFFSMKEMMAPTIPPLLTTTRKATSLTYSLNGAQDRKITLSFESIGDTRNTRRGTEYSVSGHELLIGEPDPSLEFIPDNNFEEEPLFG